MYAKISAVVFDLGNVLIPFDYTRAVAAFNSLSPGMGDTFIEFWKANYPLHRAFERGDINEDEFTLTMLNAIGNKITPEAFKNIYADIFTVNEQVSGLLQRLKPEYQLFLLSNTNSIHMHYGWKKYPFITYFDGLVLSHEAGAVKPEPEIYRHVMRLSGLPAEQHLFIDDVAEYAEAARQIGWSAVQFTSAEELLHAFKKLGITLTD